MGKSIKLRLVNIVTLSNLICGTLSITFTMAGQFHTAAILILAAVILDSLDGKLARVFDCVTELGRELDSLCDLISFGLAPAILVYAQAYYQHQASLIITLAVLFFCICGALRLARFNVMRISGYYVGLPITAAGFILAAISVLSFLPGSPATAILLILLGILMVSRIKVPKI